MTAAQFYRRFPILETRRLLLREIVPEDAQAIFEINGDDETARRYYGEEALTSYREAFRLTQSYRQRFIEKRGLFWGICFEEAEEDKLVGFFGLTDVQLPRLAHILCHVAPRYWRRGIYSEATAAVLDFCFVRAEFNRVEGVLLLDNYASQRANRKLGFTSEGVLREYEYWQGDWRDAFMISILRSEYLESVRDRHIRRGLLGPGDPTGA